MTELNSGSFLIYNLEAPYLGTLDKALIERLQPVGIQIGPKCILPGVPYDDWFSGYQALISEIKTLLREPLLFIISPFYCGQAQQYPVPFTTFPRPFLYRKKSRRIANAIAQELSSLGVNLILAPYADVYGTTTLTTVRDQTFGGTGEIVSKFCCQFQRGLQDIRVMGCASSFPGDGYTVQDDKGRLLNLRTEVDFRSDDIPPFIALIDSGIEAIQISQALFPALDPENIACLSSDIVRDLLRKENHFEGLVLGGELLGVQQAIQLPLADCLIQGLTTSCNLFTISPSKYQEEALLNLEADFQTKIVPSLEYARRLAARTGGIAYLHKTHRLQKLNRSVFQQHGTLAYEAEFNVSRG